MFPRARSVRGCPPDVYRPAVMIGVVVAVVVAVYWAATIVWVRRQPPDWRWPGERAAGNPCGISLGRTEITLVAIFAIIVSLAVAVFQIVLLDLL